MTENHLEKSRLVVAIVPSDTAAGRGEFRGIADAAGRRGWTLEMIDRAVVGTDLLPFHARLARADGIVARMGGAFADGTLGRLGVPVVGLDATPAPGAWACVTSDAKAIGTMAADELRSTPRASYVFVPMLRRYHWTEGRGRAFLARIRKAGGNARLYAPQTEWDWVGEREALAQWLAALPRPIGIFAGNDVLARFCLGACHSAGLDVPRDAAILGADDDEALCLATSPALSSIRIDFEGMGRRAAELLEKAFARGVRPARPPIISVPPLGVARRTSTLALAPGVDPRLTAGLDFIALHACDPLVGVPDVASAMGMGRRQADRLFHAEGKTIREHLEETRLARVQHLLRSSDATVRDIASECGFSSETYLTRLFRRRCGVTPGGYRQGTANAPDAMS